MVSRRLPDVSGTDQPLRGVSTRICCKDHEEVASVCGVEATRFDTWASLRCPLDTARGSGTTAQDTGVLHEGPGLVQYGCPLASTPRTSWSRRPGADRLPPMTDSLPIRATQAVTALSITTLGS